MIDHATGTQFKYTVKKSPLRMWTLLLNVSCSKLFICLGLGYSHPKVIKVSGNVYMATFYISHPVYKMDRLAYVSQLTVQWQVLQGVTITSLS